MSTRKIKRCLVMIEYGDSSTGDGEVYDLTQLVLDMLPQATYQACIGLNVEAQRTYTKVPDAPKHELSISFSGNAGNWVFGATHLADVVNSALPDGEAVVAIKRRAERLGKKVDALKHDAMVEKLKQVAAVRHQHPIAQFTARLPEIAAPVGHGGGVS